MPFLGQDWRAPGDQWVKTTEGWEKLKMWRLKLLENLNENIIERFLKHSHDNEELLLFRQDCKSTQPHVLVLRNTTREQKMCTSLSEALNKLDLSGAVRDQRRFNYVAKLVELLIQEYLVSLSGGAQRIVFNILEEMVNQGCKDQRNLSMLQDLVNDTREELIRGQYSHVGSNSLWRKHHDALDKMNKKLSKTQIKEREDDGNVKFSDLPPEVLREIFIRLPDGKDVIRTGMTAQLCMSLADDSFLWRDLCLYHFTDRQVVSVIRKGESLISLGWKKMYERLHKRYKLKETYAEMLYLCKHCNALFWKCHGHPCFSNNLPVNIVPVTPAMCVQILCT